MIMGERRKAVIITPIFVIIHRDRGDLGHDHDGHNGEGANSSQPHFELPTDSHQQSEIQNEAGSGSLARHFGHLGHHGIDDHILGQGG